MVEPNVPDSLCTSGQAPLLQSILLQLVDRVRRDQFEPWFRSLALARADDRDVELSVTSQFVKNWLQNNYLTAIRDSITAALGGRRRVSLSLREEDGWDCTTLLPGTHHQASTSKSPRPEPTLELEAGAGETGGPAAPAPLQAPASRTESRGEPQKADGRLVPSQLNPNYTFDKFVVGPCNRLAHAAALAIAENPGRAYNPLFIHGNVGLGKSHLLQAICQTVMARDPKARVLYLSCEDFTNTYIRSIQSNNLDDFRRLYRSVDVLVVDDVQFLANKEKTQEEFFHTFNALYDLQKQIVMSSDRPPAEIPTVEERLVSRFRWGLVAEIEAPCFETRVAIVRRKAKARSVEMADEVAYFIAERVTNNIRELEGAVIKVVGIAAITDRPITVELAEEALRGVAMRRQSQVSVDDVMSLITSDFAISARDLTGKSRTQAVSLPRQIAMFLVRDHTDLSLEDIGRVFGNRDHTTVLYAVGKIRERSQKDRMFKEMLDGLSNRLMTRSSR